MNPYEHFCSQDFKSCVSTNSTTRADSPAVSGAKKKSRSKSGSFLLRAENETRTRDPNLGKVVLYQLSYFRISMLLLFLSKANAKVEIFRFAAK